jgi:hypothetical protein
MIKAIDKVSIMNKARAKYRLEHDKRIKEEAEASFDKHKDEPLFVAGIMLYWAEGKMTQKEIYNLELNNSDPELLKIYRLFLHKYLNIEDSLLRVRLFLYPDLDEDKTKIFWARSLNIPLEQFTKSYVSDSRSSVTKNKLMYGTCSLYVTRKDLRLTMAIWIERFIERMRG